LVSILPREPRARDKIVVARYYVFYDLPDRDEVLKKVAALAATRPLSKFGIEPYFKVTSKRDEFLSVCPGQVYCYTLANTHRFAARLRAKEAVASNFALLSPIRVSLETTNG